MFILKNDSRMTPALLADLLAQHKALLPRYDALRREYLADHDVLHAPDKAPYKPDNRLAANFAGAIVDTLNGFFAGIPAKALHDDTRVSAYLARVDAMSGLADEQAELVKLAEIYGNAFELVYLDGTDLCVTAVDPQQAFVVYDDSIVRRPLFGVRYYRDVDGVERGSFCDDTHIIYFAQGADGYSFEAEEPHAFGGVPLIEHVQNDERRGVFEGILTLLHAYDKALSEKANDVDYYADAYLSVLGAELDETTLDALRDSRIINLTGADAGGVSVQFLQKPDADATQEHLIDRMERLIFQLAQVANISDESFGSASGVALKYKLLAMANLANTMERKLTATFNRRWKLIAAHPLSPLAADDWMGIRYKFTRNFPANLLEESEIAGNLAGVTSEATRLAVLSCVSDVSEELARMGAEKNVETMNTGK